MKKKILLIEDDPGVCSFVNRSLLEEGFDVSIAMDGETGLKMARASVYDIVVLDIMLPAIKGSGFRLGNAVSVKFAAFPFSGFGHNLSD